MTARFPTLGWKGRKFFWFSLACTGQVWGCKTTWNQNRHKSAVRWLGNVRKWPSTLRFISISRPAEHSSMAMLSWKKASPWNCRQLHGKRIMAVRHFAHISKNLHRLYYHSLALYRHVYSILYRQIRRSSVRIPLTWWCTDLKGIFILYDLFFETYDLYCGVVLIVYGWTYVQKPCDVLLNQHLY